MGGWVGGTKLQHSVQSCFPRAALCNPAQPHRIDSGTLYACKPMLPHPPTPPPPPPHPLQWRSCQVAATAWGCTSPTSATLCARGRRWTSRHSSAAPRVGGQSECSGLSVVGECGAWAWWHRTALDVDAQQKFSTSVWPPSWASNGLLEVDQSWALKLGGLISALILTCTALDCDIRLLQPDATRLTPPPHRPVLQSGLVDRAIPMLPHLLCSLTLPLSSHPTALPPTLTRTAVYLVDRVIPMLPRLLCEELCSLNPGVDRLAFSVVWDMDSEGDITCAFVLLNGVAILGWTAWH